MTRSQKTLLSSSVLFFAAIATFQLCLYVGPSVWPIALDLTVGFAMGVLLRRAGFRYLGWFIPPLLIAILAAGPHALFAESGEAHGWASFALIWLVASGVGIISGYFVRRFVTK